MKITINNIITNKILLTFLVIGMLEPRCVGELADLRGGTWLLLHRCNSLLSYLSIFLVIVITILTVRKISLFSVVVILFESYCVLSDINNSLPWTGDFVRAIQATGLVLLLEVCCKKGVSRNFLEVMSFWLGLYILINIITILLYPEGMYVDSRGWIQNYFLGYKNSHIYIYLPYLACSALRDVMKFGQLKLRYYMFALSILAASVLAESLTTVIVCLCIAVLIIFGHNASLPKWLNAATAMIGSAILSIAIIGFNFQERFSGIIQILFNKDATFSNRVAIWKMSIIDISHHPILGNGNGSISIHWYWDVNQCHNKFLDILFVGGIILMMFFILILYLSCSRLINEKDKINTNIITFVILGYAILFLMESRRPDVLIFLVFAFAYHINCFDAGLPKSRVSIRIKDLEKH